MPNLPAPYVSPWKEFARNLRALWADLGLRGRELWRRNREGDLSVPAFWPRDLVPLFWPALLSFALMLLAVAAVRLASLAVPSPQPSAGSASTSRNTTISATANDPASVPAQDDDAGPRRLMPVAEIPAPEPVMAPAPEPVLPDPAEPPPLRIDPLLDLFLDGSAPEGVLLDARPVVEENRLVLRLAQPWWGLTEGRRQELAQAWHDRAVDLGYGALQLVDSDDRLIGRSARVGTGMILFNSVPAA